MIRPPAGVLFVCLGNICRSPTAEYVARTEFEKLGLQIPVASRGLGNWHVGQGADPRAVAAALLAIVIAGTLGACGKKEPLKPPPGSTYPRQYPPPAK